MTTKKITFDPDASAAPAANFNILGGANFEGNFEVVGTSNTAFSLEGYSGSSQMTKSTAIGSTAFPAATFTVGIDTTASSGYGLTISLGSTDTRSVKAGRYVYDILVGSGATVYRIVDGNIQVRGGVSSAP